MTESPERQLLRRSLAVHEGCTPRGWLVYTDATLLDEIRALLDAPQPEPRREDIVQEVFCEPMRIWREAIRAKVKRIDAGEEEPPYPPDRWHKILDALDAIFVPMKKSNLLWRLIYAQEPIRTEPCPIHKGHWSGCKLEQCECSSGLDVTGWLPIGEWEVCRD